MANTVNFKRGLQSALPLPANRDADTLYFVTDKGELYLGAKRFSDVILAVAEPTLDTVLANQIHIFGNKLYFRGTKTVEGVTSDAVITVDVGAIAETLAGLRTDVDNKVASVSAADKSVNVDNSTATAPKVSVNLHTATGEEAANILELKENGLYVPAPAAAAEYSLKKLDTASTGASASYQLTKDGNVIGAVIDIPKDMVVESGTVVTVTDAQAGEEGFPEDAGTYIKLVIANKTNDTLWINVGSLIEYVTSGSAAGDMVFITVDPTTHKVTANITDGTITLAKLHADVQTEIGKAHTHADGSKDIVTVDGDLSYDADTKKLSYSHPTTTAVTAAFAKIGKDDKGHVVIGDSVVKGDITGLLDAGDGTYDAKGSAAAVLGTSEDTEAKNTVYGAKAAAAKVKTDVIGAASDGKTADTINGAKAFATDAANSAVETALSWGSF